MGGILNQDIAFNIGKRLDSGKSVTHSMIEAANFNHGFIGTSGAGKTFNIRKFALEYWQQGCTVFIIDTQGDFSPEQFQKHHGAGGVKFNVMPFGYEDNTFGVNPFVINAAEKGGGFYHAERNVLETIRLFNGNIGSRQKALLRELITSTYLRENIHEKERESWVLEAPTLDSMYSLLKERIKQSQSGMAVNVFERIAESRKQIGKLSLQIKAGRVKAAEAATPNGEASAQESIAQMEEALEGYKSTLTQEISDMVHAEIDALTSNDKEDELIKVSAAASVERLFSLDDLLSGMIKSRLFSGENVSAKSKAINILDLSGVSASDLPSLFHLLLDRIFQAAVRTCKTLNPSVPSFMFGFDEAKVFTSSAESPMSPINRIYTEGRKYGLGTLTGLQSPGQLTNEIRSCMASMFLFPIARDRYGEAKKLWSINKEQLDALQPQRDGLYSLNSGNFIPLKMFA